MWESSSPESNDNWYLKKSLDFKEIQGNAILTAIRKRKSWEDISRIVKRVTDKKAISNEKIKQRQKIFPIGETYKAVKEYKTYTDQKDPFLIYSVNKNEHIYSL